MVVATIQKSLDKSIDVLRSFGILPSEDESSRMADLLQELVDVHPDNITAIARVMEYMGSFNELVRNEIKDMKIAARYEKISALFDSIVNDARKMIGQLDDGTIDMGEKISNLWMKLVRGGVPKRFDRIEKTYQAVAGDTAAHLKSEERILEAYMEFRGAVKEAESLAYGAKDAQAKIVEGARQGLRDAQSAVEKAGQDDQARSAQLQLARDRAQQTLAAEEKKLQLVTDIAEHLKISYNVGETVIAKLQQTHDAKEQVYKRSVTFFSTNEHVFTALAATYTSQLGLHETTQTVNAMTEGVNKSLETLAEISGKLEGKALEAAHGVTVRAEVLKKLVDVVVEYQTTSRQKIRECREAAARNAEEIERAVEDGKRRAQQTLLGYAESNFAA